MPKRQDPVDVQVGKNIRIFRTAKGYSQTQLGKALGVTFQQVQKYEKGLNRVGSSRLAKLSKILGVPINRLFADGLESGNGMETSSEIVTDLLIKPYAIRMLRALANIPDQKTRRSLVILTETIAVREE